MLDNDELNKIVHINDDGEHPGLRTAVLRALYDVERSGVGLAEALEDLRIRASESIGKGARTLVISDRDSDHTRAPIPSLLAVAAVHHHLVRTKERTKVALVVESGDAREVHHIALLIGYGAAAVNPYLAFESIEDLIREGELTGIETATAVRNYLKALGKGVMKVMTQDGYLDRRLLHRRAGVRGHRAGPGRRRRVPHRNGQPTRRSRPCTRAGQEVKLRHRRAYPENPTERVHRRLEVGGEYQFRREGELHLFPRKRFSWPSIRLVRDATTSSPSTPRRWTASPVRVAPCAGCSPSRPARGNRCRCRRSNPWTPSVPGSTPGR